METELLTHDSELDMLPHHDQSPVESSTEAPTPAQPEVTLSSKSFAFALRIVKLHQFLAKQNQQVLNQQVLRTGTAIGALVRSAEQAETAESVELLALALKEANETAYWLDLLHQAGFIPPKGYQSILPDIQELISLLSSHLKIAKSSL